MADFTTLIIDKSGFDPDNDPHRPKIGDTIKEGMYVAKVEYLTAGQLFEDVVAKKEISLEGFDDLFIFEHPERPFVKYRVWGTKKKPVKDEKKV